MMDRSSRFWDRIAEKYARRPIADELSYQRKLEVTRGYLRPDMEMLEFASGTGSTAIVHAPHVKHIRAIDISQKMLAIARGKAEAAGIANIDFEQGRIESLRVPAGTCDVVLGMSILHLLEDREAVISSVHAMLKPGGVFVSSTTCLGETMKFMKVVGPIGQALGLMPLVRVFTPDELAASIADAGFAIDHRWQPGRGKAVFIVAKKRG